MKASDWRPIKNLNDIKHGPDKAGVLLWDSVDEDVYPFSAVADAKDAVREMDRGCGGCNFTHWQSVAKPKPVREQNQIAAGWNWHPAAKPKTGKEEK